MQAVYVLLLSLFISMVLVPPLARFASLLGLTDKPGGRKIHLHPIPRVGGIAIVIGAIVPILFLVPWRQDLLAFVSASLLLFVFGVLDDRFDLDYRLKFLGQISAALIVTLGGGIVIEVLPFLDGQRLSPFLAVPLTAFLLVAITNAVNLSDGLDGLAGGISLLAIGCLALLAYQGGDPTALAIALAMIGATFGFLRFNSNPALIFMGDTGSQFLGFGTAVLTVIVTQRLDSAVGKLIPLLILGMPILDTTLVIIRRIAAGRSPFSPDRLHLHHQLLDIGWTQYQAVIFIYLVQALMVFTAYMMRFSADYAVLTAYILISGLLLWTVRRLSSRDSLSSPDNGRHWMNDRPALEGKGAYPARTMRESIALGLPNSARAERIIHEGADAIARAIGWLPYLVLRVAVPTILVLGAILSTGVGLDIGWLAIGLLAIQAMAIAMRSNLAYWMERLATYMAVVAVLLLSRSGLEAIVDSTAVFFLFVVIGIITGVWMRYATGRFKTSTLDVLILIMAMFLPALSGYLSSHLVMLVLQCVIMFYAIEVLLAERTALLDPLRISVAASLVILSAKGLL
ncbi:glycosyltransferase family 4 protein [Thiocystis violacea]|uniref:glycosyltransferase family 4 protein n=1 Tax=Thiocystis violacea TaxID=13725 RepID=UPI0019031DEC|nr:MraY family glycosyltransferase [Thiocystis violacea]MBK1720266.1 hypothetical protein [Thiocystis violacea]